jgi:cytochrome c heme-lyase
MAGHPTEQLAKASAGGCPVGFGAPKAPEACKGQAELNVLNNMEAPNQQPALNQPYALPKRREESSIRNSDGSNWVYPSEQVRRGA